MTTPHYIVYGSDLRLPYDILDKPPPPLHNTKDYAQRHLMAFHNIHKEVGKNLKVSPLEIMTKQHRRATKVVLKQGDIVMKCSPFRGNKLSKKFFGPFGVGDSLGYEKYKLIDPSTDAVEVAHVERLRRTKLPVKIILARAAFKDVKRPVRRGKRITHSFQYQRRIDHVSRSWI